MNRVAVGCNRGVTDFSVFIGNIMRRDDRPGSAIDRFAKSEVGIFYLKSNVADAITMKFNMFGSRMFWTERR
ncbi:hypothetical protein OFB94_29435, partial [Escherichia coli]|nr:hypothetical protein [Escherichia coli]